MLFFKPKAERAAAERLATRKANLARAEKQRVARIAALEAKHGRPIAEIAVSTALACEPATASTWEQRYRERHGVAPPTMEQFEAEHRAAMQRNVVAETATPVVRVAAPAVVQPSLTQAAVRGAEKWARDQHYTKGSIVSHDGNLWRAEATCRAHEPGVSHAFTRIS